MTDSFHLDLDTSDLDSALDQLAEGMKIKTRPAAQSAAQMFYDEAKMRVPVSSKDHWFHGTSFKINGTKYLFDSGNLRNAIYQVYSKDNSDESKSTYHVAWNHKKVPYGFMVEFGTSRAPAHPFLRPSFDSMAHRAIEAAKVTYAKDVQDLIAGLKS